MPAPIKGLYAPRFTDLTFGMMGIGSALLLGFGPHNAEARLQSTVFDPMVGTLVLGFVVVFGIAACLYHRIDRRSWDDYMAQIVSQSALIGMVTFLMAGAVGEIVALQLLGGPVQLPMIMGGVPMACLGWAIGYGFLRVRGTDQ